MNSSGLKPARIALKPEDHPGQECHTMEFNVESAIDVLNRTPGALRALLHSLSDDWTRRDEGPDTWSPYDVVGHLIHNEETNWIPRAELILEHGESRPFEPLDRFAQLERFQTESLEELLERFAILRRQNLGTLQELGAAPEALERRGTHPDFGPVTLRQLLATWVVHDLNHLGQIAQTMSKQVSEAVGPWKAFLPILSR